MADFRKVMVVYLEGEISSSPKKALCVNRGENGLTYMGIYQSAHPTWFRWGYIQTILEKHDGNKVEASIELYQDKSLTDDVYSFLKKEFWDKAKLDLVNSQKIAEEIFVFGTNANMPPAIKLAQKLVGVKADGVVGQQTINALNSFNVNVFDEKYDELEREYYTELVIKHPQLSINSRGWINRSELALIDVEELCMC